MTLQKSVYEKEVANMRIIAGKARRLPLKTLPGKDTRPTTDRIKETFFNMLAPELEGAYFLDLFAGSGQIGLEAISRGSAYCVFVDNNKKACEVIRDNMEFTKLADQCMLMNTDVRTAIRQLEGKFRFDLIFMDPPYHQDLEPDILHDLSQSMLLKEDALIIVEADEHTDFSFVKELGYSILKEKIYKTNKHVFLSLDKAHANA
ncbi:MAG: 16S rRNA (guanine(966)-N(2))-methyltransferase RsmD [bacterium]|nr:16S rRNA (guanine(966)-N(2))-methyltransferase RsmD [bacterium]MDY4100294.1 16S rRNA (guanine(966)-N(2))-methyltransferase RsmD [Lachnospiraceae bacterium]